jgi:hypothetical protein
MEQKQGEVRNGGKIARAKMAEQQAIARLSRDGYSLKALANYNHVMVRVEKRLR